jgi:hypothetical protein
MMCGVVCVIFFMCRERARVHRIVQVVNACLLCARALILACGEGARYNGRSGLGYCLWVGSTEFALMLLV